MSGFFDKVWRQATGRSCAPYARDTGASLCGLIMLAAGVTGCANPNLGDLQRFVEAKKAENPGRIEPIPEIRQIETFLYEDQDRRDPFRPMEQHMETEVSLAESGVQPDFNRRKEELEGYSLDAIRMVGVLEQMDVTWGLVKTKDNTIHRVRSGNYIGRNHGRIMQVAEDRIELTEIVQDGSGGFTERQASLALTE